MGERDHTRGREREVRGREGKGLQVFLNGDVEAWEVMKRR